MEATAYGDFEVALLQGKVNINIDININIYIIYIYICIYKEIKNKIKIK